MGERNSDNTIFSFELKVTYDHSNLESCSQKCLLPLEKFPTGIVPGSLCICTVNSEDIVCFLYPLDNKYPLNFCAIDKCVTFNSGTKSLTNQWNILTQIKVLENATETFDKLNVKVYLNKSVFDNFQDLTLPQLVKTVKTFLTLYTFPYKSKIDVYDCAKSLGIQMIEILPDGDCDSIGSVTNETELLVENVELFGSAANIETNQIAGLENATNQLCVIAGECALREKIRGLGIRPSFNTLIVGPTGCGKTSVCHSFILNNHCNLFEIQSSEIIKSLPGETEEELRRIFDNAKKFVESFHPNGLTVIFVENIDLLCPADTSTDKSHMARISGQLVSLLDDLHRSNDGILVLGTTSNLEFVNSSIRRPGRFENEILIHSPSEKQRQQILTSLLRKDCELPEEDFIELLKWIACRTPGYVGADLALLVNSCNRQIYEMLPKLSQLTLENYREHFTNSLKSIKPTSLRGTDVSVITSELTFEHIGGMDDLKKSLHTSILAPIKNPESFHRFGLQPHKGILLYGPPGCAKTMIAKCLANEANMTFISTSAAEVYSPYVGDAEKFILKIFNTARKNAPCLVFFDEIDALVGCRQKGTISTDVQTRVLSTLLTEMDGIGVKLQSADTPLNSQILIVGATNRPDVIDNALMRPGRFDRLLHVPPPDFETRLKILQVYRKKMSFANDINIMDIANRTDKFSGADLCNLCNESALQAITRSFDAETVTVEDFEDVLSVMKPSLTLDQIEWYRNFEKQHLSL